MTRHSDSVDASASTSDRTAKPPKNRGRNLFWLIVALVFFFGTVRLLFVAEDRNELGVGSILLSLALWAFVAVWNGRAVASKARKDPEPPPSQEVDVQPPEEAVPSPVSEKPVVRVPDPDISRFAPRGTAHDQPSSVTNGLVRGRHYSTWPETIQDLMREGRHVEAFALLPECMNAAESGTGSGSTPGPWFYEQSANVARMLGDYNLEIRVLTRWLDMAVEEGADAAPIQVFRDRLAVAQELAAK